MTSHFLPAISCYFHRISQYYHGHKYPFSSRDGENSRWQQDNLIWQGKLSTMNGVILFIFSLFFQKEYKTGQSCNVTLVRTYIKVFADKYCPTYYFGYISSKLHEIEKTNGPRGRHEYLSAPLHSTPIPGSANEYKSRFESI